MIMGLGWEAEAQQTIEKVDTLPSPLTQREMQQGPA